MTENASVPRPPPPHHHPPPTTTTTTQVGRKPFNIKESESLQYALMQLQEAPGFQDPRWALCK